MENQHNITRDNLHLMNHLTKSKFPLSGKGAMLFSVPFIGFGIVIVLMAMGKISAEMNAPTWVVGLAGSLFLAVGLVVFINGIATMLHQSKIEKMRRFHPNEPWMFDYNWSPQGAYGESKTSVGKAIVFLVFIAAFMTPFAWVAQKNGGITWIFGIFAVILVIIAIANFIYAIIQKFKYRSSFLRYQRFPYFLGDPLEAELECSGGIGEIEKMTFTLRCIEERHEEYSTGNNRKVREVRAYQIYADTFTIDQQMHHSAGFTMPLYFDIPEDVMGTNLSKQPPIYWEIEVQAETPGVNFEYTYLVPIYQRQQD